jgi:CHAD domain-containing protein
VSYRIAPQEGFGPSAARCAREQVAAAVDTLTDLGDDPVAGVHAARKNLKKARSALRLVAPGLGRKTHRVEDRALRDAGRLLAVARDAAVRHATLRALLQDATGRLPAAELEALGARFAPAAAGAPSADRIADARALLEGVLARAPQWPVDDLGRATLVTGMTVAYRRGRQAREAVAHDPTVEALHAWRKRVKDLWYHHRLIRDAWPPVLGAITSEADALAELLGDDHDLAMLRPALDEPATGPLVELLDERRAELQARAARLGARLYAEKPKAFAARVDVLLARWAAEEGAP